MTIIEQIKAEIERRKGYISVTHFAEELLSFISTLESEKPMDQEGLEGEIDRLWESFADEMGGPHNLFDIYARLARHFYELGKQSGSSEIPKDLDEAAEKYQDDNTIQRYAGGRLLAPEFDVTVKEVFIAGAKWQKEQDDKELSEKITAAYQLGIAHQKEQMMKEAVEADVMLTLHDKTGDISLHTGYLPKELGIKCDDKVRVIIVKED